MNTNLFLRGVRLADDFDLERQEKYVARLPAVRALQKGLEFCQPVTFFMG